MYWLYVAHESIQIWLYARGRLDYIVDATNTMKTLGFRRRATGTGILINLQ